jgi:glucose-1-phosphate adenylyltransferase
VLPVTPERAPSYGVVRIDASRRIVALAEKPRSAEQLAARTPAADLERLGVAAKGREHLANMGMYLFRRDALLDLLASSPLANDFVLELFPRHMQTHRLHAHVFDGYWDDIGTIRSYFAASLALAGEEPPFDFQPQGSSSRGCAPAGGASGSQTHHCLLSDGCLVEEGVRWSDARSALQPDWPRCCVRDAVLLGANYTETDSTRAANQRRGRRSASATAALAASSWTRTAASAATSASSTRGVQNEEAQTTSSATASS